MQRTNPVLPGFQSDLSVAPFEATGFVSQWLHEPSQHCATSPFYAVGTAAANQALSEKRAQSVVAWLVAHGTEAGRLTAVGFGQTKPIADNATEEGNVATR